MAGWVKILDENAALSDIGDVTLTSITSGEALVWTGSAWENQTLAEFGAFPVGGGTFTGSITTRDIIVQNTYKLKFDSGGGGDALFKGSGGGGLLLRNYADSDYAPLNVSTLNASGNVNAGANGQLAFGGGGIRACIKSSASDVIMMRDSADSAYANLYCNNFYPQGSISIGTSNYYDISGRVRLYGYANGIGEFKNYDGSALAELRLADPSSDATAAITQGWLNTGWIPGRTAITSGLDTTYDYLILYDASASTTKKLALQYLPAGTVDHSSTTGLGADAHHPSHKHTRGDARHALLAKGVTNGDSHDHSGGDGAQIDHGGLAGLTDDDHTQYLLRTDAAWKAPVRVVATTNINRTATQTIDGVALLAGERILLTAETSAQYNGVWVVSAGAWSRATDMDSSAEFFRGLVVLVNEGTAGAGTIWRYDTATSGFTLDTTTQTWTQISGGSGITAALISRTVYTTGSAATHTPNGSAQKLRVICVGAGGGGGGAAQGGGQSGVGGGGGSGGIADKWWTPSGNITYTVGAFGAKGAAGNNAGTAGGDTTASGTGLALTAKGGNGGLSMAFGTTHLAAAGGAVNTGTTGGDFNVPTGDGGAGVRQGGTLGLSGNGASCGTYGHGGAGGQVNSAGNNGLGYGSGGGGAHANGAGGVDMAGGDGAGGLIIIEEYY